jgi:lysyl-tRNA synthetase, class II
MSQTEDQLISTRREKHRSIVETTGYPSRFVRSATANELHRTYGTLEPATETETQVEVAGRLMLHRSFGRLQFGTVRDGTGTVQLVVDESTSGPEVAGLFADLDLGDWVGAAGTIMTTKRGELSVRVGEVVLLQKALRPLPDKWHGLVDVETRSRQRYLDLMVNEEARRVAAARIEVVSELRRQFEDRGFVEVETPVLLPQATGATARPFVTTHNALDMTMYLRIATELYLKRLVVGGMERVFEVGRIFRNEGVDATHNPEFTMLEAYQAFADFEDIMELVEEVIVAALARVGAADEIEHRGRPLSLRSPFRRERFTDLVSAKLGAEVGPDTPLEILREHARSSGVEAEDTWTAGRLLAEIYEEVVEDQIWEPTFVTHPPIEVSPLSRRNSSDPRLADRFELVIAGSEYANAFSELNDPDDQRARFEEQAFGDESHPVDEDYLLALEYGLPPTGGLGIGVDRLVMLATGQTHIREVILFPTLRPDGDQR